MHDRPRGWSDDQAFFPEQPLGHAVSSLVIDTGHLVNDAAVQYPGGLAFLQVLQPGQSMALLGFDGNDGVSPRDTGIKKKRIVVRKRQIQRR